MQSRVQKWGNSLALRIPKSFATEIGLAEDQVGWLGSAGSRQPGPDQHSVVGGVGHGEGAAFVHAVRSVAA